MKKMAVISLCLLLFSCYSKNYEREEIDRLNHRITLLEEKIDALISGRNINLIRLSNINKPSTDSYSTPHQSIRCQAITKKGTQCKRKAKTNGYCWQHGG